MIYVLGSSGFIGKNLISELREYGLNVRGISSTPSDQDIYWDYKTNFPHKIIGGDIFIDCARSQSCVQNIERVKNLLNDLHPDSKYLFISSAAVCKKPNFGIFFSGDDYIREKKQIEKLVKKNENASFIRPDIILGEGGVWQEILRKIDCAPTSLIPNKGKNCAQFIHISELCSQIVKGIIDENIFSENFKIVQKTHRWSSIFNREVLDAQNKNLYFDNPLKNLACVILFSIIIPDFIAFRVIEKMRSTQKNSDIETIGIFNPEGMQRFYFEKHMNNQESIQKKY